MKTNLSLKQNPSAREREHLYRRIVEYAALGRNRNNYHHRNQQEDYVEVDVVYVVVGVGGSSCGLILAHQVKKYGRARAYERHCHFAYFLGGYKYVGEN